MGSAALWKLMGFAAPKWQEESHGFLFEADRPKQIAKRPAPYMFRKFQKLFSKFSNVLPFVCLIRTHIYLQKPTIFFNKKLISGKKTRPFTTSFPLHSRCFDISHVCLPKNRKVFGSGPGTFAQHRWSSGAGCCFSSSVATYGDRDQDASHGEAPNQGMFGRYGRY